MNIIRKKVASNLKPKDMAGAQIRREEFKISDTDKAALADMEDPGDVMDMLKGASEKSKRNATSSNSVPREQGNEEQLDDPQLENDDVGDPNAIDGESRQAGSNHSPVRSNDNEQEEPQEAQAGPVEGAINV